MYELQQEFERYSFNMPGYSWSISTAANHYQQSTLRFKIKTIDSYGKQPGTIIIDSRMLLHPFPIPREWFPSMLRHAVHEVVLHEADEWLKCDGEIIFNPHK